jgi:hypothetical protein
VVDEVVLQTYQGHHTIPGYGAYMAGLGRLKLPFKIGLVQDGEWSPPVVEDLSDLMLAKRILRGQRRRRGWCSPTRGHRRQRGRRRSSC